MTQVEQKFNRQVFMYLLDCTLPDLKFFRPLVQAYVQDAKMNSIYFRLYAADCVFAAFFSEASTNSGRRLLVRLALLARRQARSTIQSCLWAFSFLDTVTLGAMR